VAKNLEPFPGCEGFHPKYLQNIGSSAEDLQLNIGKVPATKQGGQHVLVPDQVDRAI